MDKARILIDNKFGGVFIDHSPTIFSNTIKDSQIYLIL